MTIHQPSKSTRYESSAQEKMQERKVEEKQIQRLQAILAKKMGSGDNTAADRAA